MPFGDGTGPRGFGPMTGRCAGFCTGYAAPGSGNFAPARICRGGGGRGWRNRCYATGLMGWQRAGACWDQSGVAPGASVSPDLELATLKTRAENLTRSLEGITKRIETLETRGRKEAE